MSRAEHIAARTARTRALVSDFERHPHVQLCHCCQDDLRLVRADLAAPWNAAILAQLRSRLVLTELEVNPWHPGATP